MTNRPHPSNDSDPLIGKTLAGRYLVKELIDRGGMGRVYKAEQQPLGRSVALKTLDLLDPRGEFRERFFNEASTASRLNHPNTVRIFDYGRSDDGVYFLTMELLEGQSLHKVVKKEAPLDPLRVIHIIRQVCGALHEAHEQGIVHRDLKPGNIYLTRHGDDLEFAKVLDFGLVKNLESDVQLSQTGQALGSPLYMSPEQVEGDAVDRRSDIYSLGLVMYVALTGRVPFKKGSIATIMMQQVTGTIPSFAEIAPDVDIPFSLEWIVRACIEKRADDRIASMRELSRALKVCASELRGELAEPVEWRLAPDGTLDLGVGTLPGPEDTNIPPTAALLERAADPIAPVGEHVRDIPSSPTLNASSVSTRTMAGAAVGFGLGSLLLIGVGLVGLLLLGVVAYSMSVYTASPEPEPVVQPAPPVEVPDPVPVEPVGPVVHEVQLSSEPTGAEVLRDGRLLGTTPLTLKVTDGEDLLLSLQADGHQAREIVVDGTVDALQVPLKRTPRARPVAPRPAPVDPRPDLLKDRSGSTAPSPKTPNMTEIRDPWEDG